MLNTRCDVQENVSTPGSAGSHSRGQKRSLFERDPPNSATPGGSSTHMRESTGADPASPHAASVGTANGVFAVPDAAGVAHNAAPQRNVCRGPPKFRRQRLSRRASTGALRLTPDGGTQGKAPRKRAKVCAASPRCFAGPEPCACRALP